VKHGLRTLGLMLVVCALGGAWALPAQAYVYWTNVGPGNASDGTTLGRINNDSSGLTHSLVGNAALPGGIAVGGTHLYWANAGSNSIGRAGLSGAGVQESFIPNATNGPSGASPDQVALDSSHIYWTDGARYVGRANLDGSNVQPRFIDAGSSSYPSGIAVANGTIYLSEQAQIDQVPVAGGTPTMLTTLSGSKLTFSVAVAGGYVYWAAIDTAKPEPAGSIGRIQTDGVGLNEDFIQNLVFPSGVATDGSEIYWVDRGTSANVIGRALLGTVGATNIQPSFVSEPGGPYGVAVDDQTDPTQTRVACAPNAVLPGSATSCTATVADSASSAPPTGPVVFSSNGTTFFSGSSSSCSLTPRAGGAACVIGAVPLNAGTVPISAFYGGDAAHGASSGFAVVCAGTATQCGTGSPPPPPPPKPKPKPKASCVVPKLAGKTLAQAQKLLRAAHCALGKVTRPRAKRGHRLRPLVVGAQHFRGGRKLAVGTKVALALVEKKAPPKTRRHR
jgi:virginiamycin B lyase